MIETASALFGRILQHRRYRIDGSDVQLEERLSFRCDEQLHKAARLAIRIFVRIENVHIEADRVPQRI